MDLVFLLGLPGLLWIQSWHLLGFYTNPRTLGIIAAAVAIILFGVVLFQDKIPMFPEYGEVMKGFLTVGSAFSAFVLVWAIYAALVAGVYLWGLDARSLGFYGLFLWIISALFAVYFFIGGEVLKSGDIFSISWLLGVVAILLAILSALLFFYLALLPRGQGEPPSSAMRSVTGYFYLVFSIVVVVLGLLLLLGLDPKI
jgi:hypothetical protein